MKDRAAADAINSYSVDKVRFGDHLMGTNRTSKETEGVWLNGWEAEPSNIGADSARLVHWRECYGDLWKLKVAFEKQHNR